MAVINVGVDFESAQAAADEAMALAPEAVYDVQVMSVEEGNTKAGRPRLKFNLQIVNAPDPSVNGKKIGYFCNLPHQGDNSGVGFLIAICNGLGKPWVNDEIDTDAFVGCDARANVGISKDKKWNEITSFVNA
jgi:flavin-binding protein dodecin